MDVFVHSAISWYEIAHFLKKKQCFFGGLFLCSGMWWCEVWYKFTYF